MARTDRHDCLAGVHRRPGAELPIGPRSIQFLDGLQGAQARPNGPLGVIGVGDRSPEDRHDGIADELLHRPTEPLDLILDLAVVFLQEVANVLRIRSVGSGSEPHKIDEQDRDDLALFPCLGGVTKGRSARRAEPGLIGILLAARGARGHGRRVHGVDTQVLTRQPSATAYRRPGARNALELVLSAIDETESRAGDEVLHGL